MIELRWATPEGTTTKPPTLQWRHKFAPIPSSGMLIETPWSEWQEVPTVVIPRPPYVHDFARCTKRMQALGVAYPRTCAECGLGPCRAT